jgi:uncharacterized lipoprotein YbaY
MSVMLVLLVVLVLTCSTCDAAAQRESGITVTGDVTYTGLDALPWHTRVHIYVADTSSKVGVVAEKTIVTEGEQIPIDFSLAIPGSALHSGHRYTVCADISILEKPKFLCDTPVALHLWKPVNRVKVSLKRLP